MTPGKNDAVDQKSSVKADDDGCLIFDGQRLTAVEASLGKAASQYLEAPWQQDLPAAAEAALDAGGIVYSLTTATAHPLPLAQIITDRIASAWPDFSARAEDLVTVLNEALANGLLHGNLGVASADARDPMALKTFYEAVAERLADRSFANRRITLTLHKQEDPDQLIIQLLDEGDGFDIAAVKAKRDLGPKAFSGRGLSIIETFSDGLDLLPPGNHMAIRFNLEPS